MRRETHGTGITAREVKIAETADEVRDAMAGLVNRRSDRDFSRSTAAARHEAERIQRDTAGSLRFTDSPQAFAADILQAIRIAEKAIAEKNSDLAASMAFHAGVTWERARMKWLWEDKALKGGSFSGSNVGEQGKTASRIDYLQRLAASNRGQTRKILAFIDSTQDEGKRLWPGDKTEAQIFAFLKAKKISAAT